MKSLIMYLILPITLIIACLSLIIFGEDVYRYPCQDPANWTSEDCQPPACEAMGLCTKYLVDIPDMPSTDTQNFNSETPVPSETNHE